MVSVWDRVDSGMVPSVYTEPVLNWNGTVPHGITLISGPIWHQIPNPIRTGSTRSRVKKRLIRTNFVPVPIDLCLIRRVLLKYWLILLRVLKVSDEP